jgi:hypothetical protein
VAYCLKTAIWEDFEMPTCSKCNHWNFSGKSCECKPFQVFGEEFDEDGEVFYGQNYKDVVQRIAEKRNCEQPIFDENLFEKPITVIDQNGGVKKNFQCSASISIDYFVEEIEEEENKNGRF